MRRSSFVVVLLLSAATRGLAQRPAPVTGACLANAVRRTGAIRIDGKLDEAAWERATVATDFVQSYPTPNARATDPTEVRVLYDDVALYVGVRMYDAHPDSIATQLARRDPSGIYTDWAHVIIDSYHDRRTAFTFSVTPVGVKRDALEFNDNNEDANWDAIWTVGTTIDSLGWTAEFRIPFSQLRFSGMAPGDERIWGFQVFRDVARRSERDAWSPWTPGGGYLVSRFGDLGGIFGVKSAAHTELLPYVSGKLTRAPSDRSNPFFRANATKPSIGADFKMALPRGLTLTGAVNPDFGQVEVDPQVVNLSEYETFFPEKRPFFVEGAGIFGFGQTRTFNNYEFQQYFYSRRVGRAPSRSLSAAHVDAPDATPIAGAAKLSGRAGAWTLGLLDAVTPAEDARFIEATDGTTRRASVEPLTNYFVGRVKRDFSAGRTFVGAMLTGTERSLGDTALASLLHRRATFGGLDFEQQWNQGEWYLSGYAGASEVYGTPEAIAATQRSSTHYFQQPGVDHLRFDSTRTSLGGGIAEVAIQRNGALVGSLSLKTVTPGFDVNDLGFQNRGDYHALSTLVGYQSYEAGKVFRSFSGGVYTNHAWNYGGEMFYNGITWFSNGAFTNFWSGALGAGYNTSVLNDRLTRGGPLARTPGALNVNASIASDGRQVIAVRAGASATENTMHGGHVLSPFLSVTARPASYISVTIAPTLVGLLASQQYIQTVRDSTATATYGSRYVFGRLHQTTVSADTRVDWTFTPALSLQVYAQPFVSAGRYTEFKELARASGGEFDTYGVSRGTIASTADGYLVDPDAGGPASRFSVANPDFNVRSLRGNAVLRWEYRPGSALFVVWQQQRVGAGSAGDFEFSRDVSAIFREPVTNVFLVKVTYWMGR